MVQFHAYIGTLAGGQCAKHQSIVAWAVCMQSPMCPSSRPNWLLLLLLANQEALVAVIQLQHV